jgi:hypothetical protein
MQFALCHQGTLFLYGHLYSDAQSVCWGNEMNLIRPDALLELSRRRDNADVILSELAG